MLARHHVLPAGGVSTVLGLVTVGHMEQGALQMRESAFVNQDFLELNADRVAL